MSVHTLPHLLFAAVVALALMPVGARQRRQLVVLAASYAFCATWSASALVLLGASTAGNFLIGRALRRWPDVRLLAAAVVANVLFLATFKYLPPFIGDAAASSSLIMPIGMSFWTFQAISHLVDTYRGDDSRPSLLEFSLYMAFWPTVVAGPICRLEQMLPQFRTMPRPTRADVAIGVRRIVTGLFMKTVLAGLLERGLRPAWGVSWGFDHVTAGWGAGDVLALAIGAGFLLYFDFAGYSHLVIGIARLLGLRLPENFDHPFLATTPAIFWTRWHMSLSFWIRDYVFFPLALAIRAAWWRHLALVLAMVLFGLWHGATWTFIAWGLYHGLLLVGQRVGEHLIGGVRVPRFVAWPVTFLLVSVGWVFFRSGSIDQALAMLHALVVPWRSTVIILPPALHATVAVVAAGYFAGAALQAARARWDEQPTVSRLLWWLEPIPYAVAVVAVIARSHVEAPFVYSTF